MVTEHKTEKQLVKAVTHMIDCSERTPKKIVADCGREFDTKLFKDFCDANQIEFHFASPKRHKNTGAVERAIGTYRSKLRKPAEDNQKK